MIYVHVENETEFLEVGVGWGGVGGGNEGVGNFPEEVWKFPVGSEN